MQLKIQRSSSKALLLSGRLKIKKDQGVQCDQMDDLEERVNAFEQQAQLLWKQHLTTESQIQFQRQEELHQKQIKVYIDTINQMRVQQATGWLNLFEQWTNGLQLTAVLSLSHKLPLMHLDNDVTSHPSYKQQFQKMNDLFQLKFEGPCEDIKKQLQTLNTNLEVYNEIQGQRAERVSKMRLSMGISQSHQALPQLQLSDIKPSTVTSMVPSMVCRRVKPKRESKLSITKSLTPMSLQFKDQFWRCNMQIK